MATNKPIPLHIQLRSVQLKLDAGTLKPGTRPLWQILLTGVDSKRPSREAATVQFALEIADHPQGMNEALQRQHHLAKWLQEGGTHDDFIRMFGPEK